MAYYDDGYTWAQEHTTYFPLAYQDPVSFHGYEPYCVDTNDDSYNVSVFNEPKSIDYSDYSYDYDYCYDYDYVNDHDWYSSANPTISYYAHNYTEPKLIVYEPVACDTGYVSYHTKHSIAYSQVNLEYNEPEFEEYDPTPYGGGYDIVSVYGKPLPPSDQTCYPRSKPKSTPPGPKPNPESQPPTKFGPEPNPIPLVKPEPVLVPESRPEPMPVPESKPEPELAVVPVSDPIESMEVREKEREREEYSYPNYGYDYPWPEYDNGNAVGLGYDYGYGKQVVQIPPCEYSPEVVDLCENIFGSWPCLARIRKQQIGVVNNPGMSGDEITNVNPWEECASYIFGRPLASYK